MEKKPTLRVYIYSALTKQEENSITAIHSFNSAGEFSILPDHAQFVTLVENTDIKLYKKGSVVKTIPCDKGVLHVKNNSVHIYLGLEDTKKPTTN